MIGLCPFHDEKTPSFSVNEQKYYFHCFGCNAHGDIFEFVMQKFNYSFSESLQYLCKHAGIEFNKYDNYNTNKTHDILLYSHKWFRQCLGSHSVVQQHLLQRFSKESIDKFELGYVPKFGLLKYLYQQFKEDEILQSGLFNNSKKQLFYDRITFPIFSEEGKIIAFGCRRIHENPNTPKYINSSETSLFKKKQTFYGTNLLNNKLRHVLIVEGYTDVIAGHEAKIKNVIGVLGTSITLEHISYVINKYQTIYLCFDGDSAGLNAMQRTIKIILANYDIQAHMFKFIILPTDTDPESIIKQYGSEAFIKMIKNSLSLSATIWFLASKNIVLDKTPETFIRIDREIQKYLNLIKSPNILKYYKSFLSYKVNQIRFTKKTPKTFRPTLATNDDSTIKYLLLGIIITYPELLDLNNREEKFAEIAFHKTQLQQIQQKILCLYTSGKALSLEYIKQQLSENDQEIHNILNKVKTVSINSMQEAQEFWDYQLSLLTKNYYPYKRRVLVNKKTHA